jgi:diaminopropionate ammonia-lyase
LTFAAATDGNHGRGIAWAAGRLGHKCVIYVHSETSAARIDAIRSYGATVKVIPGNYDNAVRQIAIDAKRYGWEIISDTSWNGYTEVPTWIMQGYTTMLLEAQEQFSGLGIVKPTHIFVQAGVGALAASVVGFYSALFPDDPPKFVVVEPEKAACIYRSAEMNDGAPHSVTGNLDTICAGLACGDPSPLAWGILKEDADVFMKVPDYVAARGMRIYAVPLKGDEFIISGESGAITLGAFYSIMTEPQAKSLVDYLGIGEESHVLFLNTEGNTDPTHFRQIIWDGQDPVPRKFLTQR